MNRLSCILKSSKCLYSIYFYTVSFLLKLIGVFIRLDTHLVLFNSFGGKKYDDSPRYLYERMLNDPRFNRFTFVWALHSPENVSIPGRAKVIKTDSFPYFFTALRARVWITNSSMERGLNFKKQKTLCFNTWHGSAIKTMGIDIKEDNQSFRSKTNVRADIIIAQSQYDVNTFSHCFQLPQSRFRITGYPRNDILSNYTREDVDRIKTKLKIDKNKIVILYTPTFREYTKGVHNEVVFDVPIDPQKWNRVLGDKFVILFRAHYEVARHVNLQGCSCFMDVSAYSDLNDLMIVSDALISDYSSIYFDYSIMHKPMYCFAYDYDEYSTKRGMYINLKDKNEFPFDILFDEETLLNRLQNYLQEKNNLCRLTEIFQKKYVTEFGNATEKCCDIIVGEVGIE